jgi:hypothetical protein
MTQAPQINLLLLKLPRTGSTYLAHALRQHPLITIHQEYFNSYADRRKRIMRGPLGLRGVRRITDMALKQAKLRDLRRFLESSSAEQINGASINPFKDRMSAADLHRVVNRETHVMVLTRRNLLKQYISQLNVQAEMEAKHVIPYKSYRQDGRVTDRKFFVSPQAVAKIEQLDLQRQRLLEAADTLDVPKLYLTYEDHINVSDKEPLLSAVSEFLEVDPPENWSVDERPAAEAPRYHKLVSDDLRQVIENYDEIAEIPSMAKFLH